MFDPLDAAQRQARSLERLDHRPWPLPRRGWTVGQTWDDLLFAHWRVPVADLRAHVPGGLEIDTFEGSAWLAVAPFRITGLRARGLLPLPGISEFLELNVRTLVRGPDERPGVFFLSLDASSRLAVEVARRAYKLPYFHARMSATSRDGWIDYECARVDAPGRVFSGMYRPDGKVFHAEPGSLEWFLIERYCLYTTDEHGTLRRAEIHHAPWPLQAAEAEIELASISAVEVDDAPICHFSRRQDVLVWPLESLV